MILSIFLNVPVGHFYIFLRYICLYLLLSFKLNYLSFCFAMEFLKFLTHPSYQPLVQQMLQIFSLARQFASSLCWFLFPLLHKSFLWITYYSSCFFPQFLFLLVHLHYIIITLLVGSLYLFIAHLNLYPSLPLLCLPPTSISWAPRILQKIYFIWCIFFLYLCFGFLMYKKSCDI